VISWRKRTVFLIRSFQKKSLEEEDPLPPGSSFGYHPKKKPSPGGRFALDHVAIAE